MTSRPASAVRAIHVSRVVRAAALAALLTLAWAVAALAAEPSPSPASGGDPRSSGQGPGLVGDPLAAVLVVAAIGLLSLAATVAWVRLTEPRRRA